MSVYNFAPSPDLATKEESFATWENGFSEEQISEIIRIGDSLNPTLATVGGMKSGQDISDVRESLTSWIKFNDQTAWLYDSMAYIARQINGQFFEFDLAGFCEDFQYTVYHSNNNHYNWHLDRGPNTVAPRKLSMVLQLSDPSEYDGGDLELFIAPNPTVATRKKGLIYIFPSWVLHRVTPVTRGIRKSLVIWITGPKFK